MRQKNPEYTEKQRRLDEALLEHYDDLMRVHEYQTVLERMRRNGVEPRGAGAPQPGSPFYKG